MTISKEQILAEIGRIEETYNVTVIYACESGSRAWGFPSKDSDYDVRMVYYHPVEWYLSLSKQRDVIEEPIVDLLDISGWDIVKTLRLLRKSNPSILEWANSPIVYLETEQFASVRELLDVGFLPRASMYHYLSMAKTNARNYLTRDEVNIKKYLYAIRPLLCALWVEKYQTQPPMLYHELMDAIVEEAWLRDEINQLVARKVDMNESGFVPPIEPLNEWIETTGARLRENPPEKTNEGNWQLFTNCFHQMIGFTK